MSFKKLIDKVSLAEDAVEANERRVGADLRQLKGSWASLWTPGRIIIAGLASGFLIARAEPIRTVARSGGLLRSAGTLMSWISGLTAALVADQAGDAADAAADAVAGAGHAEAQARQEGPTSPAGGAEQRRNRANEQMANDYLERMAAAARQAGGNGEP